MKTLINVIAIFVFFSGGLSSCLSTTPYAQTSNDNVYFNNSSPKKNVITNYINSDTQQNVYSTNTGIYQLSDTPSHPKKTNYDDTRYQNPYYQHSAPSAYHSPTVNNSPNHYRDPTTNAVNTIPSNVNVYDDNQNYQQPVDKDNIGHYREQSVYRNVFYRPRRYGVTQIGNVSTGIVAGIIGGAIIAPWLFDGDISLQWRFAPRWGHSNFYGGWGNWGGLSFGYFDPYFDPYFNSWHYGNSFGWFGHRYRRGFWNYNYSFGRPIGFRGYGRYFNRPMRRLRSGSFVYNNDRGELVTVSGRRIVEGFGPQSNNYRSSRSRGGDRTQRNVHAGFQDVTKHGVSSRNRSRSTSSSNRSSYAPSRSRSASSQTRSTSPSNHSSYAPSRSRSSSSRTRSTSPSNRSSYAPSRSRSPSSRTRSTSPSNRSSYTPSRSRSSSSRTRSTSPSNRSSYAPSRSRSSSSRTRSTSPSNRSSYAPSRSRSSSSRTRSTSSSRSRSSNTPTSSRSSSSRTRSTSSSSR